MADQGALSYLARRGVSPQWRGFVRALMEVVDAHLPAEGRLVFLEAQIRISRSVMERREKAAANLRSAKSEKLKTYVTHARERLESEREKLEEMEMEFFM
jgi:hypothetical protein